MDAAGMAKPSPFPTHVGMNRNEPPVNGNFVPVPHTRGDEPLEPVYQVQK